MKLQVKTYKEGGIEFCIQEHPGPSIILKENLDVSRMFDLEPWQTHLFGKSELSFLLTSIACFIQPGIYLGVSGKSWPEKKAIMKSLRMSGYFKETNFIRGLEDSTDKHKEYYPILQKI